jgi:hypothetical protein
MSAIAHPSPVHCGQPPSIHGAANRNRRSGLPRETSRVTNLVSTGVGGCRYASLPPAVMTPSSNAPSWHELLGHVFWTATAPGLASVPGAAALPSVTAVNPYSAAIRGSSITGGMPHQNLYSRSLSSWGAETASGGSASPSSAAPASATARPTRSRCSSESSTSVTTNENSYRLTRLPSPGCAATPRTLLGQGRIDSTPGVLQKAYMAGRSIAWTCRACAPVDRYVNLRESAGMTWGALP